MLLSVLVRVRVPLDGMFDANTSGYKHKHMYTYTLTEDMEESSAMLAINYDRDLSEYLLCLWKQDIGLRLMLLCSSGRCQGFYLGNVAYYMRASKAGTTGIFRGRMFGVHLTMLQNSVRVLLTVLNVNQVGY
jgi:hypothetical protein